MNKNTRLLNKAMNKDEKSKYKLTLINDDIHTILYVIQNLMIYCNHTLEQAEQCVYITHLKGQCIIKSGKSHDLAIIQSNLLDTGLDVILGKY